MSWVSLQPEISGPTLEMLAKDLHANAQARAQAGVFNWKTMSPTARR